MSFAAKICFFVPLLLNTLAQGSDPPSDIEAMDPEEVLVSRAALSELVGQRGPNRIFLRDRTQTHDLAMGPFNTRFLRDVPDQVKADFDSRNKRPATIKPETIQFPVELKLLSRQDETKVVQQGGGCNEKEPIVFFSRPGLDSKHRTALIYVGTACYDMEHSSCLLLKKNRGRWAVVSHLAESHTIFDRFPEPER